MCSLLSFCTQNETSVEKNLMTTQNTITGRTIYVKCMSMP